MKSIKAHCRIRRDGHKTHMVGKGLLRWRRRILLIPVLVIAFRCPDFSHPEACTTLIVYIHKQ